MRIAKLGDIYSIWSEEIEKWMLMQVIEENEDGKIGILDLDCFYDTLPTKEDLTDLKPLVINHHNWSNKFSCYIIDTNKVPSRVKYIARLEPILDLKIDTYSFGWQRNSLQNILQYKWNMLDKNLTNSYKKAKKSKVKIQIGERKIGINTSLIRIKQDKNIDIWDLAKLPALDTISYDGENPKLIDFISSNPLISELEFSRHNQKELDISNTNIDKLILDISGLEYLKLNKEIRCLSIFVDFSNIDKLVITHTLNGKFLELCHHEAPNIEIPNFKLVNLEKLSLQVKSIDFKSIASKYPNLQSLTVWGSPGYIRNFNSLSKFKKIQKVQLQDLFGFDADDVPKSKDLPLLEFFWLTSIPKETGQFIKKEYKHIANLSITQLRNEKWLTENLNNPFRDWDGREGVLKTDAKKAFNAFKKLNSKVEKHTSFEELKEAFLEFIDIFNKIYKKSDCIQTIEREEIYDVYMSLAKKSSNEKALFDVFEQNAEF